MLRHLKISSWVQGNFHLPSSVWCFVYPKAQDASAFNPFLEYFWKDQQEKTFDGRNVSETPKLLKWCCLESLSLYTYMSYHVICIYAASSICRLLHNSLTQKRDNCAFCRYPQTPVIMTLTLGILPGMCQNPDNTYREVWFESLHWCCRRSGSKLCAISWGLLIVTMSRNVRNAWKLHFFVDWQYHWLSRIFDLRGLFNTLLHRNEQAWIMGCIGGRTLHKGVTMTDTAPLCGLWVFRGWWHWLWAGLPSVHCGCISTWTSCMWIIASPSCECI